MAYDAIGDMVVTAARAIEPSIDKETLYELPGEFMTPEVVIAGRVTRPQAFIPVGDLIDDLWSEDRMKEVIEHLTVIVQVNPVFRHTFRGEIKRDLANNDYMLIVSALSRHQDDE